jgi:hypothetical protein
MTINNNNIFGAFTLNEARGSRLTGDWLNKEAVANYGWLGGGSSGPLQATFVNRIDFSSDTSVIVGRLFASPSPTVSDIAAVGNSNYGWFSAGSFSSSVSRVDYSNDQAVGSPRGPLSAARYRHAAAANSNYGWFGGGSLPNISGASSVERTDFSNDSPTASIRGPLSSGRYYLSATGNSNYGWFGTGTGGVTVDRIDFSNDFVSASQRRSLATPRTRASATGNSNYGWFGGGIIPGSPSFLSLVERIDFSNDLEAASIRGPLSSSARDRAAVANSNYGWFCGGESLTTPQHGTVVVRMDFSNDTLTAPFRGSLSQNMTNHTGTSGVLNIRRQKAGNYGWFGGGYASASALSIVNRIDFSNDSLTASTRGLLNAPAGRHSLAATGNSNYGWFGGGYVLGTPGVSVSTVDRINFSNDSVSASPRGSLSQARSYLAATGNSNYGWFAGGYASGPVATVDRINFSNDSVSTSPRSPLSLARFSLSATGNSNYGWFGGGANGVSFPYTLLSRVDRIDFSNDSSTTSPRGPLSAARAYLAATGNSNYGWFGGAGVGVERIDFSNDSVSASPRGSLSQARSYLAATGNSNYGWFAGGYASGPTVATVDRIDFSNDSSTASIRGSLTPAIGRSNLAAVSNSPQ